MNDPDPHESAGPNSDYNDDVVERLEAELEESFSRAARAMSAPSAPFESAQGSAFVLRDFGDPRTGGAPPARPSFRASLRASFLAGRFVGDGEPPAVVARALDRLPTPTVRAEFRSDVRATFLAAAVTETPSVQLASKATVSDATRSASFATDTTSLGSTARRKRAAHEGEGRSASRNPKRPSAPSPVRWRQFGAALAMAAAVITVIWLRGGGDEADPTRGAPRGTTAVATWDALGGRLPGGLTVDGIDVADAADFRTRLARGGALRTGTAGLRLALGAELVVDLGPHTTARLPDVTVGASDIEFALDSGSLRLATSAAFRAGGAARRLAVRTAHIESLALGTIFGVDCDATYTCVCCLEGEVATTALVALADGVPREQRVAAGRTRLVFGQGEAHEMPLVDGHREPLEALRRLRSA